MTKKRWVDRFVKQFTRRTGGNFKEGAKDCAYASYHVYGEPESDSYDKDYSPEDSADDEIYELCSDA